MDGSKFTDRSDPGVVVIKNSFLQDPEISFKAKGILAHMKTRRNGWRFYEKQIASHSTDGRDSVRSGIKELLDAGYLVRGERVRDERGILKEYEYFISDDKKDHESAVENDQIGKSNVGLSNVGESDSNKILNRTKRTNDKNNKDIPDESGMMDSFNAFWSMYPSKKGKQSAVKHWKNKVYPKLKKGELTFEQIEHGTRSYLEYCKLSNRSLKDGSTAVNEQVWSDDWTWDGIKYGSGGVVTSAAERSSQVLNEALRKEMEQSGTGRRDITDEVYREDVQQLPSGRGENHRMGGLF